jgi:hypothetical protein
MDITKNPEPASTPYSAFKGLTSMMNLSAADGVVVLLEVLLC